MGNAADDHLMRDLIEANEMKLSCDVQHNINHRTGDAMNKRILHTLLLVSLSAWLYFLRIKEEA